MKRSKMNRNELLLLGLAVLFVLYGLSHFDFGDPHASQQMPVPDQRHDGRAAGGRP